MLDTDCFISIVAPLHNDSDIVGSFIQETTSVLARSFANYEIVLVDDGSTDDTAAVVATHLSEYERLRLIRLSRRFGQEIAISAGLDSVIGDFVVVMLPESDPPELVTDMVDLARKGAEIVFGIRRSRRTDPWFLRVGAGLFYWFSNKVLSLDLPKDSTHFRVLSRRAVNALIQMRERSRYLRTLSQHVGYENRSYKYDLIQRRAKPRTKNLVQAVELAVNIVFANTLRPLHMVSWLAVTVAALNAAYLAYIVIIYLFKKNVAEGWVTMSLQDAVMFLFLFLILAVLCEYVGRIFDESKGRPLYYVMEEKTSSVMFLDDQKKNVVTESTED